MILLCFFFYITRKTLSFVMLVIYQ
jgi:hypothetical protein